MENHVHADSLRQSDDMGAVMMAAVAGLIGGGKSLFCARQLLRHVGHGGKVFTNLAIKLDPWESEKRQRRYRGAKWYLKDVYGWDYQEGQIEFLTEEDVPRLNQRVYGGTGCDNVLVVLDEVLEFFDSEDRGQCERRLYSFLRHSRKFSIDFLFIAQTWSQMNKRIRDGVQWVYRCIDMQTHRIPGVGLPIPPPWRYHILVQRFDRTGREECGREWMGKDERLYGAYDTDDTRTTATSCVRGKSKFIAPKKAGNDMTVASWAAVGAAMGLGVAGAVMGYKGMTSARPPGASAVVDRAVAVAAAVPAKVEYITADWGYGEVGGKPRFGFDGAVYGVGDFCPLGRVVSVLETGVMIEAPDKHRIIMGRSAWSARSDAAKEKTGGV